MKEVLSLITFGIGALLFVCSLPLSGRMSSLRRLGRIRPAIATRKLRQPSRATRSSLPQRCGLTWGGDSGHRRLEIARWSRAKPALRLRLDHKAAQRRAIRELPLLKFQGPTS